MKIIHTIVILLMFVIVTNAQELCKLTKKTKKEYVLTCRNELIFVDRRDWPKSVWNKPIIGKYYFLMFSCDNLIALTEKDVFPMSGYANPAGTDKRPPLQGNPCKP